MGASGGTRPQYYIPDITVKGIGRRLVDYAGPLPGDTIVEKVLDRMTEKLRPGDDPTKGGVKKDAGKRRLDLVPPEGVTAVADILTFGATKYGDRNWEQGMDWSRPYGACLRHLFAWWSGENNDPETGYSHLWHAACNLFFLVAYEARGTGKDDRPTKAK